MANNGKEGESSPSDKEVKPTWPKYPLENPIYILDQYTLEVQFEMMMSALKRGKREHDRLLNLKVTSSRENAD